MKKLSIYLPLFLLLAICSIHAMNATSVKNRTLAGFEKIRSLVGQWDGTLPDGKPITITYEEISGGAIVEIYHSTDPMWWNMSTAYHLDTDKIIMTHYCSWGNHPRMNAFVPENEIDTLKFDFIDITTTEPDNGYMHGLTFDFKDKDHINHNWIWHEKGKDTPLTLTLQRNRSVNTASLLSLQKGE